MRIRSVLTVCMFVAATALADERMQLVTTDGKSYDGVVVTETGRGVVFQTQDKSRRFVPREKIATLVPWAQRAPAPIPEIPEAPPAPPPAPVPLGKKVFTTDGKRYECSAVELIENGLLLKTNDGRTLFIEFASVAKVLEANAFEPPNIDARCPGGKEIGPDTNLKCCWPGQVWGSKGCRGIPSCAAGMKAVGEECVEK